MSKNKKVANKSVVKKPVSPVKDLSKRELRDIMFQETEVTGERPETSEFVETIGRNNNMRGLK